MWRTDGRTHGQTDARKNNAAVVQPYHKGKWCCKFGWIPPNGLGGDSVTDKGTDDGHMDGRTHRKNDVAIAHPKPEGKWCCKFDRIPPSCLGGDTVTDRQTHVRTYGHLLGYYSVHFSAQNTQQGAHIFSKCLTFIGYFSWILRE